ncbi:hypothetical protein B0H14DRAFT_3178905 [Mycena olivaceomarginata]|nr:hypothetical protein B0H14DRAFT_3178905 [Mycena olivaceomarginata]
MGHIYARPRVVSGISLLPSFPPCSMYALRYLLSVAHSQQCRKLSSIQAPIHVLSIHPVQSLLAAQNLQNGFKPLSCGIQILPHIPHSSSSAPRQLPPGFSTSHTLDSGSEQTAAAECLVFFAQFPETLCLSPKWGAERRHSSPSIVAFCPPRDQAHRPLKPNHPRARDFAALGDAQTSSRCPKRSEDISLHSIQGATTTIWWLPPQRLPISDRVSEVFIPSTNCHHLGLAPVKAIWYPAGIGAVVCDGVYARCHNIFDSEKACEQGKLTPLVHFDGLRCVLTSNFGNDVLWPPPPGLERQYKMSYSSQ